jgi:O-antigen ligase
MWKAGRAMVKDHPLTGVGPGRVKQVYPEYRLPGYLEPKPGHLHNNLIMIAAETGLPSVGCYLWFLFAFFRGAIPLARGADPRRAALAAGAVASMAALFVAGIFEYNFGDVEVLRLTLLLSVFPFLPAQDHSDRRVGPETEAAA